MLPGHTFLEHPSKKFASSGATIGLKPLPAYDVMQEEFCVPGRVVLAAKRPVLALCPIMRLTGATGI